jgi:hypothetical protein
LGNTRAGKSELVLNELGIDANANTRTNGNACLRKGLVEAAK